MAQPPAFSTMVDRLRENQTTPVSKPKYGNMPSPPGNLPPGLDLSMSPGMALGNSPSVSLPSALNGSNGHTNGNGIHEHHHHLAKSDTFTPPKKMTISVGGITPNRMGGDRVRVISPSPTVYGLDYLPGPLSPPMLGGSPGGYAMVRSSSREDFPSPRNYGITPRRDKSSPIPIERSGTTSLSNSPSPSPSCSPFLGSLLVRSDSLNMLAKDGTSRANWTLEAIKKHPEIQHIIERVRPVARASSFGKTYIMKDTIHRGNASAREELVGKDYMIPLILQHLHYEGLRNSKKILEDDSNVKFSDPQLAESRLVNLLRLAIKDTERVWELALSTNAEAGHLIEEHLQDMALLADVPSAEPEDVNIWDEPEEGTILFAEEKADGPSESGIPPLSPSSVPQEKVKVIKAGSLNRLVGMLAREEKHDIEYMKTFLLTYQSFTTPYKLLAKLIQRYDVPRRPAMSDEEHKKLCLVVQLRVVNVIKGWIKDHWSDFNEKLISQLKAFIDGTLRIENKYADMLTSLLQSKRPEAEEEKRTSTFNEDPPEPKVPKNIFSLYLDLFDVDEEEIARQLTLIDFEIYSSIKMSELLNQSWNKPKLRHRSPNVIRMINRFNETNLWVATSILRQEKIRDRTRTMAKFIRIADYLKQLNNFNTTMAILSGLNGAAVHRLKHTREDMPRHIQQAYTDLQHALDSNQSYKGYRNLLAHANPPCIPYLGVYLTDLTFIEDGNQDCLQKLINFTKRKYIYDVIAKVKQYQHPSYNLQPVYQIASLLITPVREHMDEDKQFKVSLLREPRNVERSEIV